MIPKKEVKKQKEKRKQNDGQKKSQYTRTRSVWWNMPQILANAIESIEYIWVKGAPFFGTSNKAYDIVLINIWSSLNKPTNKYRLLKQ